MLGSESLLETTRMVWSVLTVIPEIPLDTIVLVIINYGPLTNGLSQLHETTYKKIKDN